MTKNDLKKTGSTQGFSLVETLLVLAFISGGVLVAIVGWQKIAESLRIDSANQTLSMVEKGANSLSAVSLDYAALSSSPRLIFPADMFDASGTMKPSPWGTILVSTASVLRPKDSYSISLASVPVQGCARLAAKNIDNFALIEINGVKAWKFGDPTPSPADLVSKCSLPLNTVTLVSSAIQTSIAPPPGSTCLTGAATAPDGSPCVLTCGSNTYLNSTRTACIALPTCSNNTVLNAAKNACEAAPTCPWHMRFDPVRLECLGPPTNTSGNVCDAYTMFDYVNWTCVPNPGWNCTGEHPYIYSMGACQTTVAYCSPGTKPSADNLSCVSTCTNGQFWEQATSKCVSTPTTCSPGSSLDANGVCQSTPVAPVTAPVTTTTTSCGSGQVFDQSTQSCVGLSTCQNGAFINAFGMCESPPACPSGMQLSPDKLYCQYII